MIAVCAACKNPKDVELHTGAGWVCRSCLHRASTVILTYIIDGVRYPHLVKKMKTETTEAEKKAAGVSGGTNGGI